MKKQITTLCMIHRHPKLLLGMKKRGFGEGRWNGFGGKVEGGEDLRVAALRELEEESGLVGTSIKPVGVLNFHFEDETPSIEAHIFSIEDFKGSPKESEEMKPQWFDVDAIPYDSMWPDDRHWLPLFLEGKHFEGEFHFTDSKNATVLKAQVTVLN